MSLRLLLLVVGEDVYFIVDAKTIFRFVCAYCTCIKNRIELVEERRGVFSSEFVLKRSPYFGRGFMG